MKLSDQFRCLDIDRVLILENFLLNAEDKTELVDILRQIAERNFNLFLCVEINQDEALEIA